LSTQTITPEQALALINGYQSRPLDYIRDVYGTKMWSVQEEIVLSVFRNRETAVKTCNSIGKSFIAARIAHAFLDLYPGSIVVTTAPTWRQVKDVLWRYFGSVHKTARYNLGGHLTQNGLEYDTDWYAIGFSTKYPDNFQGYHADHILVIADEAGGVSELIFRGIKAITPNVNARILYIGNPTNPDGEFHDLFSRPRVAKFSISAFDTPNLRHVGIQTLEDLLKVMTPPEGVDPLDHNPFKGIDWPFPELISPEVVYDRYFEWGADSPAWQALVMGEFPSQAEQSLIPADLVRMAMEMHGVDEDTGKTYAELSGWNIPDGPPEFGLDVARFGPDLNVLTPRHGGWVDQQLAWGKKIDEKTELFETAEQVLKLLDPLDWNSRLNLDDSGLGGGVTSHFRYLSAENRKTGSPLHQFTLMPYVFGSKNFMRQPEKFHDITSELYWNLRSWFYKKQIALYYDKELFNQLVGRRWSMPQGKIKVESKDEYKKRTGGKSPDKSDSLALAFAGGLRAVKSATPPPEAEEYVPVRQPFTSGISAKGW